MVTFHEVGGLPHFFCSCILSLLTVPICCSEPFGHLIMLLDTESYTNNETSFYKVIRTHLELQTVFVFACFLFS